MEPLRQISEQRAEHEHGGYGTGAARHSYLHTVRAAFHPHSIYCSLDHMREQFEEKNKTARYLPIDWSWNDGEADAIEYRAGQMGIVADDFLSILLWDTHVQQPVTWHCPVSEADEQSPRAFLDTLAELAAVQWPRTP